MIDTGILKKIQYLIDSGNDVSKSVCCAILNNIKTINNISIDDLAKIANVSKTSIMRTCNKMGLDGFKELKIRLKLLSNLKTDEKNLYAIENEYINSSEEFLKKYNKFKSQASLNLLTFYHNNLIYDFINAIDNAKRVFVFAFNLAYSVIRSWAIRLTWVKKQVFCNNDFNVLCNYVDLIEENDVCIFISLSGENTLINDFYEKVKRKHNSQSINNFIILGHQSKTLFTNSETKILINCQENEIWDLYSITAQTIIEFLDLVYYELLVKNVK